MTTFAGSYIQEPSDLRSVCTELDIISSCDDPGGESARDVETFTELTAGQKAAIVAVMNDLITGVERTINGYATKQGYAIPLSPLDADVKKLAARLLWIDMRQRSKALTAAAAEEQRKEIRNGDLSDIAKGKLVLTAARTGSVAPSAHVYSITDAARRDTTGSVPRMSRKVLGGF